MLSTLLAFPLYLTFRIYYTGFYIDFYNESLVELFFFALLFVCLFLYFLFSFFIVYKLLTSERIDQLLNKHLLEINLSVIFALVYGFGIFDILIN